MKYLRKGKHRRKKKSLAICKTVVVTAVILFFLLCYYYYEVNNEFVGKPQIAYPSIKTDSSPLNLSTDANFFPHNVRPKTNPPEPNWNPETDRSFPNWNPEIDSSFPKWNPETDRSFPNRNPEIDNSVPNWKPNSETITEPDDYGSKTSETFLPMTPSPQLPSTTISFTDLEIFLTGTPNGDGLVYDNGQYMIELFVFVCPNVIEANQLGNDYERYILSLIMQTDIYFREPSIEDAIGVAVVGLEVLDAKKFISLPHYEQGTHLDIVIQIRCSEL